METRLYLSRLAEQACNILQQMTVGCAIFIIASGVSDRGFGWIFIFVSQTFSLKRDPM